MNKEEDFKKIIDDLGENFGADFQEQLSKIPKTKVFNILNFAKEEESILDKQKEAISSVGHLLSQNILSLRNYLLALVGFSLTIVGVSFSLYFSANNIIKSDFIFGLSVFGFLFVVIGSLIYLSTKIYHENSRLSEFLNFHKEWPKKLHLKMIEYFNEEKSFSKYKDASESILNEIRAKEEDLHKRTKQDNSKKDNWILYLTYVFIVSLFLVFMSLFFSFSILSKIIS